MDVNASSRSVCWLVCFFYYYLCLKQTDDGDVWDDKVLLISLVFLDESINISSGYFCFFLIISGACDVAVE